MDDMSDVKQTSRCQNQHWASSSFLSPVPSRRKSQQHWRREDAQRSVGVQGAWPQPPSYPSEYRRDDVKAAASRVMQPTIGFNDFMMRRSVLTGGNVEYVRKRSKVNAQTTTPTFCFCFLVGQRLLMLIRLRIYTSRILIHLPVFLHII